MKIILILLLGCVMSMVASQEMNVSYGTHPQQAYDIYLPDSWNEETPVVVFIHGGGWQAEHRQRDYYKPFVQRLFNAGDNIIINMDYRLVTPGGDFYVFPDQIEDVENTIKHAQRNFDLSHNPVVLTGNSAGGHLALWYYFNQITPIDKIIPICAPYDGTIEVRPGVQYFQASLASWLRNQFIDIEQYDFQTEQEAIDFASPHTFANRELNDILYVHMTGDPLHQLEAVQRDYPDLNYHIYDTWHSGWMNQPHRDDLIERMIEYIGTPSEICKPPVNVDIQRTSHTTATIDMDRSFAYQGSANRAGRPLRPYPMYGMGNMIMPHSQSSLVPAFDYDIWLRTICADGTFSPWSEAFYIPLFEDIPSGDAVYYNLQGIKMKGEFESFPRGFYIKTDGKTSTKTYKK